MILNIICFYLGGAAFEFIEQKAAGAKAKNAALMAVKWPITTAKQLLTVFKG